MRAKRSLSRNSRSASSLLSVCFVCNSFCSFSVCHFCCASFRAAVWSESLLLCNWHCFSIRSRTCCDRWVAFFFWCCCSLRSASSRALSPASSLSLRCTSLSLFCSASASLCSCRTSFSSPSARSSASPRFVASQRLASSCLTFSFSSCTASRSAWTSCCSLRGSSMICVFNCSLSCCALTSCNLSSPIFSCTSFSLALSACDSFCIAV
mmetsp:Transcript_63283/g.105293  ORF Transcript_63283/g.105293 Transcript_63283/m.105293 type:complete len:209 (+) Transcript_63283:23-649(+)